MKKLLVVSAVAVLGLGLTSAFAGGLPEEMPAAPVATCLSDTGIYLGLQGGWGFTNWRNAENVLNHTSINKDNGIVGRVFAGYDINRYFAVEGGYSYFFNKASFNNSNQDIKNMAFDLMGKGKLPVMENFDLYAKLGVDYLMSRVDNGGTSINNFNVAYGAGMDYCITPNIIANLEWLRLNGNARISSNDYQPSADSFMIGLRYKFDL